MKYLVDSDRVIEYLKGIPATVRLLSDLTEPGFGVSTVTIGEVLEGILFSAHPDDHRKGLEDILLVSRVLVVTEQIAARYAEIRGTLRRAGLVIPDNDLFIAATALDHNLTLVTGNARHFSRVPGLQLMTVR